MEEVAGGVGLGLVASAGGGHLVEGDGVVALVEEVVVVTYAVVVVGQSES